MTSLLLPELLKRLAFEFGELERLLLDGHLGSEESIDLVGLDAQVRESELSTVIITTGVGQLQSGVCLSDRLLNLLPVDLEFFAFFDFFQIELDNETDNKYERG